MPGYRTKELFVLLLLIALNPVAIRVAFTQALEAHLTGEVRDERGGLVPGARITATEQSTNQLYSSATSAGGVYSLTHLKPGSYKLTAAAQGFKRFVHEGVQLSTGQVARLDVKLTVGSLSESITVKLGAPLLETESGDLEQGISHRKMVELPLDGRTFVSLVALTPGTALPPGSSFPRINGGRPLVNEYMYDGISVLQPEPGSVPLFPVIDGIQEFQVISNSPSAEFGRFNGGVVNLTTRSGSNQFHGTGFEFLRNEALNARNLFAPANSSKPLFRRNQFGGVFGGPVVRNRTFFFADYGGTRQEIGVVNTSTVPTLLERQGIFTEAVGKSVPGIYDPDTTQPLPGGGFTRQPFARNAIPASRFDPVAMSLLQRYPLPTSPGTANNYIRVGNEPDDQNQFGVRIDHRFTDRDQVFGRYSYARDTDNPVTPLPDGSGLLSSGVIGLAHTTGQAFASSYVHVFGPSATNELRGGVSSRSVHRKAASLNTSASTALNLPGIPSNAAFQDTLPTFQIDGFQQLGPSASANSDFHTDVTELVDNLSIQRGRHFIKMGPDLRWERLNTIQPSAPTGLFRFSSLFTDLPGTTGTGFALASFLLGQVQNFSIDLQRKVIRPRAHIQEYFVEDDWKATKRLTINVGVRYTLNFPSTEADNQGAIFNLQTQKLDYLGRDGFPRSARDLHKHDFGPRLGIAYRLTGETVVRSAYGLIWIEQAAITTPFTTPFFPFLQTVTERSLNNVSPAFVLSAGPSIAPISLTPDAGLGQGVFSADRQLGSGYAQQWNFSIERKIRRNLLFEIAYAGSKITHIGLPDTNLNQLTAQQLQMGVTLLQKVPNPFFGQIPPSSSLGGKTLPLAQLLKPYPRFTTVSLYRNNVGNTSYRAFEARLEERLAHGLSFLIAYTRSKLIDEASSVFNVAVASGPLANFPVADSFDRKLERDVSNGEIPNDFVGSYTYELPMGLGRRFSPAGFMGKLLSGWETTGIIRLQSGLPLAVTQATNFNAFAGFGTQRPNRLFNPELPTSQRSIAQWFNTSAFRMAPVFTLGNSSRNPVRGPSYRDADVALIKRTVLREQANLEFRAEFFNLTNTPPLGPPNTVLGTPGFGSITSAGNPRVIQLGLKLNF